VSITGCVLLGLVTAFIANQAMKGSGQGLLMDFILAVFGAVVGGWAFRHYDQTGSTRFTPWSVFATVGGAVLVLVAFRVIGRFGRVA
jgi:uncharacterized membrane protein YeaQ/YmgE (transglycosylase-associated protein family)